MTLREQIKNAIDSSAGDSNEAAIVICKLLEDEVGLAGNGWFSDDPEMEEMLAA